MGGKLACNTWIIVGVKSQRVPCFDIIMGWHNNMVLKDQAWHWQGWKLDLNVNGSQKPQGAVVTSGEKTIGSRDDTFTCSYSGMVGYRSSQSPAQSNWPNQIDHPNWSSKPKSIGLYEWPEGECNKSATKSSDHVLALVGMLGNRPAMVLLFLS